MLRYRDLNKLRPGNEQRRATAVMLAAAPARMKADSIRLVCRITTKVSAIYASEQARFNKSWLGQSKGTRDNTCTTQKIGRANLQGYT